MLTLSRTFFPTMAGTVKVAVQVAALLTLLAFQVINLPAHAESLSAADEKTIRSVVEGQLAAFSKDDADKAFSFAAPNVRKALGSAANFMSMVRSEYPVVYRPASVAFQKAEGVDADASQRAQMVDATGNAWLAVYSLHKQNDKTWLITGCTVVENKGRMV